VIGRAPGVTTVSSFFLMMLCEPHHATRGALIFADCGLIVEPTVDELAAIAIASADSCRSLTSAEPRVAMLSFSTGGSASHPRVQHVLDATARVRAARPDILIDGDLQFDAAFVPEVSEAKAKHSPLRGLANVLIFPDLEAANIGYKIAQRIGNAKAIGPVLQGLARPANDLSRGCSAEDVYHLVAITSVQSGIE
jgi:phosphate acetyltransferase